MRSWPPSTPSPTLAMPRPGMLHGAYPQRDAAPPAAWLDLADRLGRRLTWHGWQQAGEQPAFMAALDAALQEAPSDLDLPEQATAAARRLAREGWTPAAVAEAQIVTGRAIEVELGKRPYRTQHLAAFALLRDRLVEMDTGEGKSLALLLAAGTAALARVPVHVICPNEYLARRDGEAATRVLSQLGLAAGAIANEMESAERREIYAMPVVYVSAQELGFDYLRDRLAARAGEALMLPGLCLALVDEADSVLLDHGRTPLVLSLAAEHPISDDTALALYHLCGSLVPGKDCTIDPARRRVEVPASTLTRWHDRLTGLGITDDDRVRAHLLREALTARHALRRDVDYVVQGDTVLLIDPTTGRTMPGSVWSLGLHRMVCLKEGVKAQQATRTATQITMQNLMGRYCKLGGISGTLRESAWQLWWFYRLTVQRVQPRVPSRRREEGLAVYACRTQQFDAIRARVQAAATRGQAVLVGTDSVAAADALSATFQAAGVPHRLLTARDDVREADLIASSGKSGAVTIATNIAGRGTDILLSPRALEAGGLHVVCCTRNASSRIDRQLFGRAARNGQPGSAESVLSLDDRAFIDMLPGWALALLRTSADAQGGLPRGLAQLAARTVQTARVARDFLQTWRLVRHDRLSREALASAARPD